MNKPKKRIAIVHDYIRTYGGGEVVLRELHKLWPEAPIFVTTADFRGMGIFKKEFEKMPLRITWLQKIFIFRKKPILYRAILPWVWRSINLDQYDLVISSSGSNMAKLVRPKLDALHLCYCHTPPRFLYGYKTESKLLDNKFLRLAQKPLISFLKKADKDTSNVNYFIANSKNIERRIKKLYNRSADVIYPPCQIPRRFVENKSKDYYLVVSRLERNKNIDVIVEAANIAGFPLVVVGNGKQMNSLKKMAMSNIVFKGQVSDGKVKESYKNCKALLLAASDEDFGITPVEAMGYGKPVVAYWSGGFRETVVGEKTGVFFKQLTPKSIIKAIGRLENTKIRPIDCYNQAKKFSRSVFRKK